MSNKGVPLTFTFENPNTPKSFACMLKKILIDKLLSQQSETTFVKK
mgnify:FL=1